MTEACFLFPFLFPVSGDLLDYTKEQLSSLLVLCSHHISHASHFEEFFKIKLFLLIVADRNVNQLTLYNTKKINHYFSFHFIQMKAFCCMLPEESSNAVQAAPGDHTKQLK